MVIEFIGRLHPVVVHLPIGILLFAVLLQWITIKEKYAHLAVAVPIAYLAGCIAAIASCVSGWLLADSGEYDEQTLLLHRWMGIIVAIFAGLSYTLIGANHKNSFRYLPRFIALIMLVLISVTGHLGGTLTHGDGYLTNSLTTTTADSISNKKIINAQEAFVYADIIAPILQQKCGGCHSAKKQKGGLRLDSQAWILKGGKGGNEGKGSNEGKGNKEGKRVITLKAGDAAGSDLYHRIALDPLEEKHMPPKGKPQLSERERVLLQWWINTGADFNQPAKALAQTPQIQLALKAMEQQTATKQVASILPESPISPAPSNVLEGLRAKGITILTVAKNSNYLTAHCTNLTSMDKATLAWLSSLNKQLLQLKMPGMQLKESEWMQLANLQELRHLNLAQSNISNKAIEALKGMTQLNYLNLVDTKINAQAIASLKGLNKLQTLYLAGIKMSVANYTLLQQTFPKCRIDTGGYQVPTLESDTQMIKKLAASHD